MHQTFLSIVIFGMTAIGFYSLWSYKTVPKGSTVGRKALIKLYRHPVKERKEFWDIYIIQKILVAVSKLIFLDETTTRTLSKRLEKAGENDTPKIYTAKRYCILAVGGMGIGCSILAQFYLGILLLGLVTAFFVLKLRDTLDDKIKNKDKEIAQEMPRFVRTICRQLQADRDLQRVITTYRKVAGIALGKELDILLAELQSGNGQLALAHFEYRIGTANVFRLCGALRDMIQGIDQSATLSYLADSMASETKAQIRKELSLRPAQMRATYYPAVGVCIAMVLYVLVLYVINQLNSLL